LKLKLNYNKVNVYLNEKNMQILNLN
jgi:hypothetical protein